MSKEVAKQIVRRVKQEPAFLAALLADPDNTLQPFDLTSEERKFFRLADKSTLEGLSDRCFEIAEQKKVKK
jgi:hypothetical protein